jgi:ATP-binding cassette subfamily B protein
MLRRFWLYARPYLPVYSIGLALLFVTNGLSLWIPALLRRAIRAIEGGAPLGTVAGLALTMIVVALVQAAVRTASRMTILGNSRRIVHDVRNEFFAQLQRLGASFYDRNRTGDIMSRGVNDMRLLQGFYGPGVMNLLNTAIVYCATLVLLLRIDVTLTLISLGLYPLLFVAVNQLSRRVYSRSLAVQEQLGTISNLAQENISGIQQVKTYVQEAREIERFRDVCAEYRRRNLSMAALRGGMVSLIGVVAGAGTLVVLYMGGRYVVQGRIDFGDFVAFNAYLGLLVWPTIALGWIINTFQRGAGAMERIAAVLDARPDVPPALDESAACDEPLDGPIEIRGLTFEYAGSDGASPPAGGTAAGRVAALHGIDLTIERGSRVALVGPVGSGKSTLANLLARIYPVPRGKIFVDGRDITEIPVGRLRRSIGYVPQEAFLFSRSVRENVAFGNPQVSEEEVQRAIEVAQLAPDLRAFPHGLDTVVGERGFTLSGGQRQRATLARALVGAPRILILDDSLSSLDADTERAVLAELDAVMARRTSIVITHRLSTLVGADRIVVLEHGRIVEEGPHAELIRRNGVYARLFRRQQLEERLGA